MIKSEISVRFVKSMIFFNLVNFGNSWWENDASARLIMEVIVVHNYISDNLDFNRKAV